MSRILNKDQLSQGSSKALEDWNRFEEQMNQMQQFRTYSYHHILMVGNTTAAAQESMTSDDIEAYLHKSYEDKHKPIKHADGGSYMVLINGMTDAEYLIQSIEMEMIINPNARLSNTHSTFIEGTMEIMEPKGVRFLNLLKKACDDLECDPNGLTFALKTVFVGYTDEIDKGGRIKQILNVDPFYFTMMDLTAEFNSTGAIYLLSFIGSVNGSSRMPMYSKIQQANVSGGTIQQAVDQLVKQLNDNALKSYETVIKQIDESNNANKKPGQNYSPTGRKVQYSITVHPDYKDLPLDNTNNRNRGGANVSQLATPQGIDIESALSDIMYCSTEVLDQMNRDIKKGYKNIFKIESSIEFNIDVVNIVFAIKKCKVPVYIKDNVDKTGTLIDPYVDNRPVVEFDYIFTGHNTEILEYDMKMTMGLVFFQSLGSTNNFPGQFHAGSGDITTQGSGAGTAINDRDTVTRKYTPIPASATIVDPNARNKVESAKTGDFRTFMARQAALESVASRMKISGVPWILDAFNQSFQDATNESHNSLQESIPLFKVLVKMPSTEDDFRNNGKDFTEQFWYDGYFMITSVKHIFRDGRFTQEFDMIALPYEEMVTPTAAGAPPAKRKTEPPPVAVGKNPTPPVTAPTTKVDKSTKVKPVETAEQKAKLGEKSKAVTPKDLLNCQSIRANRPITMDSARRTQLSPSFTLEDLIRRPINLPFLTDQILDNLCLLAKKLEEVQTLLGHKITINSGYRCPTYNSSTPGSSKTSDHMRAIAADIVCPAFGGTRKIFETLKASGLDFRQVIREHKKGSGTDGWVHVSFNIDASAPPIPASKKFFELEV